MSNKKYFIPKNANQYLSLQWVIIFFASGESCLQFIKNAMSAKHKAKCTKMRYAFSFMCFLISYNGLMLTIVSYNLFFFFLAF